MKIFSKNSDQYTKYKLVNIQFTRWFFDIKKPSIIGVCDRKLKNSFGVMFDDILCGIVAGVITLIIYKFTVNSKFFELINC